jgi:hypothetical protein
MENKIFPEGVTFTKRQGSPDFVLGQIGINIKQFNNFIEKNPNLLSEKGWLNLDALISAKTNQPYTVVNTFSLGKKEQVVDKGLQQLQQQVMNREPVIEMGETSQGHDGEVINPEDIPF